MTFLERFWWLMVAHALTDYVLQPEWMGEYKSPSSHPPTKLGPWWWHMTAHGLLNGGGVALVTHSWQLGVAEMSLHSLIDTWKCLQTNQLSTWIDQGLHVACKILWAVLA